MKEIPLTQGKIAIVDDEDYVYLSQFKWYAVRVKNRSGEREYWYAGRGYRVKGQASPKQVYMHNEVLVPMPGLITAHSNCDGLDNRKENLYAGTKSQVSYRKRLAQRDLPRATRFSENKRKVEADIGFAGKKIYLGRFDTAEAAEKAYYAALAEHCGEEFSDATRSSRRRADV
ncbi:pathogenesis-related transcriptional factor and ERF protein [Caballeronia udeis]|uniref:Pathogenesis-related transcriptional factor and ERF protein n=1 Tax=Caballeronia udeis TaxID=1232866 RepID=A0A158EPC8_9BURK|nr:hypothetical protein [Caballeronia udeis]SAL09333.1 pathogenesis-related transcriptional factor and ERF protein [Caballeronia udeis]